MAVVLHVGCRPKEAAWIVQKKSISDNDYFVKHQSNKFKATMPAKMTKTGIDYTWLLPVEMNYFVSVIKKLEGTAFVSYLDLK